MQQLGACAACMQGVERSPACTWYQSSRFLSWLSGIPAGNMTAQPVVVTVAQPVVVTVTEKQGEGPQRVAGGHPGEPEVGKWRGKW